MSDDRPVTEKATGSGSPWVGAIGTGIGALVGSAFAHGTTLDTKIRLLSGGVVGGILGYLVLHAAKRRGQEKLGQAALFCCVGAGTALGFMLACPIALIFYLIIRSRTSIPNANAQRVDGPPESGFRAAEDTKGPDDGGRVRLDREQ
jgi:hypothetical protein